MQEQPSELNSRVQVPSAALPDVARRELLTQCRDAVDAQFQGLRIARFDTLDYGSREQEEILRSRNLSACDVGRDARCDEQHALGGSRAWEVVHEQ